MDNKTNCTKRQKSTDIPVPASHFSLLGHDELTHVLKFLDEEASIQCELAYEVFHDISRLRTGSGDDHWKELSKYRQNMLGGDHAIFYPPRCPRFVEEDDFLRSTLYEQKPSWSTNTSNGGKLKLIDEERYGYYATLSRFFGIMAAKARKFEQHQWLYHRQDFDYEPDDNDNDENGVSSCNCEDFAMKKMDVSQRLHIEGRPKVMFVCFSLRRRDLGSEENCINQPFWQGWCRETTLSNFFIISNRYYLTDESWSKVHQIQDRVRLKAAERIYGGQEVVWTAEEKKEICKKAKDAFEDFRITMVSSHGRLIVSTGFSADDNCSDHTEFHEPNRLNQRENVRFEFRTLQTYRDRNTCKGVSVYLRIRSDEIGIGLLEKERSRSLGGRRQDVVLPVEE